MLFQKSFWIFWKKRIFHFFQKLVKITFLVKFDIGFWKSIGNKGQDEFGLTSLTFSENFQIKLDFFSEKNFQLKKKIFRNSKPLFILACPASKKIRKKIWKKKFYTKKTICFFWDFYQNLNPIRGIQNKLGW